MSGRIYDAFDSIRASEKLKSTARQRIKAEAEKSRKAVFCTGRVLAACAVLCLILGLGSWYGISSYPVSYVSIDVNPSIELCLNCWNKVIRASAYNEDGRKILDTVSVKGMYLEEAVDAIVESDGMAPYLTADAELTFTVAAVSSEKEGQIYEVINNCHSSREHSASSCSTGMDSVDKAHDNGMSFGKYAAYLQLCEYDDSVTLDACRDMTMSELHRMIREHEEEYDTDDREHGHGSGTLEQEQETSEHENGTSGQGHGAQHRHHGG